MSSVTTPVPRMKADERRELVLEAATLVFGERGYFGATTDGIAKAAGVSQPYVVRMFGTKETLFLEVLERALDRLLSTFRAVLADGGPSQPEFHARLGAAYTELLADRGLLLSLMHAFILGSDPVIGPCARRGYLDVVRFLRDEAGFSPEAVREFLAGGMLLNTLVGIRMASEYRTDPLAKELLDVILPTKLGLLLALEPQGSE